MLRRALIASLAAVALPVADLVWAVVRRTARGQSPFQADAGHIHHRLLRLGHTHRRTVLVLYMWVAAVAFGAVSFSLVPLRYAAAFSLVAILLAFLATLVPLAKGKIGTVKAAPGEASISSR